VPPPGDPLEHHAAGFAKVMCSAVFVTGLDPDFAAEHVGYFTAPYEERARLGKPVIDRAARAVNVTLPNGVRRTAVHLGDQGCLMLPVGQGSRGLDAHRVGAGRSSTRRPVGRWAMRCRPSRPARSTWPG
jgi:hypothetical protein